MELSLRRSLPALALLCALCASAVLALSLNAVVEAWLQPPPPSVDRVLRAPPPRQEALPTPLALVPLRRYLGLPEKLRQEVIPAPEASADIPTRTDLRLLGTLRGSVSFASVLESASQRTRSVWLGEEFDGARVTAIERTRVLLSRDGRLEAIAVPPVSVAAPAPSSPRGAESSIRQVGPGAYEISRQEVTHSLANLGQVAMQARVVPAFREGVAQGFKLFSIRPDSLFTRLGLRNGDILRRINGLDLSSVEHALEIFPRLREASRFELEVERDGQVMRSTYTVRG
ncbi:type II secretion system protein GspC [Archangium primigenium]|uniref:type II secretion system protein GspC n=1 Tax=[Archangium] primigenium TaxID=2792470 RepID=UPI0019571A16|nr:type II secretion system protein GspC [Archangium primigenium]MBM7114172.1 general secretion pathway protein GspC [Archangium primigenium]